MKLKKPSKPGRPFIKCADCGKELEKGIKKYRTMPSTDYFCEKCYFNQ